MMRLPFQDRNRYFDDARDTDGHWGFFWAEIGYIHVMGPGFDAMTLAQAAHTEFGAIERILSRALPRQC